MLLNGIKMKSYIIILVLVLLTNLKSEEIILDNFFDVVNPRLSIHKISETEFLLYGDKGGVVRSYDAGETWQQNYAATKSVIISMVNYKESVLGITNNSELIYSKDKGNHWGVKLLDINPTKIVANNDLLFATIGDGSISISSDMGDSWIKKQVTNYSIINLLIADNNLFITTNNFEVHQSTDFGESWNKVDLPDGMNENQQHLLQVEDNKIFIRGIIDIFKINNDLSFEKIKTQGSFNKFIVVDDTLHTFLGSPATRTFEYSTLSHITDTYSTELKYHNPAFDSFTYSIIDVAKANNVLLMTFFGKGVMRSEDYGKTWSIVSYFPIFYGLRNHKHFNKYEWNYSSQFFNINTFNAGATFKPSLDITIDTSGQTNYNSSIKSNYWFNNDSVIYFLDSQYDNTTLPHCMLSNDRGNHLVPATKSVKKQLYPILHNNNDLYLYLNRSNNNVIGYRYDIYRMSNDFITDSVFVIDSIENSFPLKTFTLDGTTYLCYNKVIDDKGKIEFTIDYTEDYFNTVRNLVSMEKPNGLRTSSNGLLISEKGFIFIKFSSWQGDQIISYRLNLNTKELTEIESHSLFTNPWDNGPIDNKILSHHYGLYLPEKDTTVDRYYAMRVNVTDNGTLIMDTLARGLTGSSFVEVDNEIISYGYQSIQRQIEKERLTSVKVENSTEIIGIWPFEPYPNPAKERITLQFYTDLSADIGKLELELINISTGVTYIIKDYNISFINNWDDLIDFDISKHPTGSYLVNMKLGEYQKSTKLIITK